ncbi:hypothetical protein GCM10017744_017740 [Streptomyces antimycoticus]
MVAEQLLSGADGLTEEFTALVTTLGERYPAITWRSAAPGRRTPSPVRRRPKARPAGGGGAVTRAIERREVALVDLLDRVLAEAW